MNVPDVSAASHIIYPHICPYKAIYDKTVESSISYICLKCALKL